MKKEIETARVFFWNTINGLEEADSGFAPKQGMMTVAQQIAHVAHTIDWFFDGAFDPDGFDTDWDQHRQEIGKVTSLKVAKEWLDRSFRTALKKIDEKPENEWKKPIADGMIMEGAPRCAISGAISDHTAHHRGSLATYTRLLDKIPGMPYMS